ncbi:DVU3141 family protein [Alteromonas macleodii]|uniref:Transmembrane anti-sigma factor n=1 Tax=Alteromonas macleodii (strain English Channel 673) TaxID=1004788 RepID=A0AB33A3S6_ALTME|nr:DVU3141 family protein [Alteromonas macleodii]AFT76354.1 putative transmembrane anti-sigma factor [Alteromonas macleodii str. 'English Channel 673']MBL3810523.1 anti-sigma factor [Alteromonas macleodii]MBL3884060.1 anti-sigma factor [Alteromonas macleodii]
MILTDEKLSAFLDGELDTAEMDLVREAIAHDVTVSDRLAALAEVDRVVKVAAEKATAVALPKEIMALLSDEKPLSQASGVQVSDTSLASVSAANQSSVNQSSAENVKPFPKKANSTNSAPHKQTKWKGPFAIAASVAVLAGLVFFNQQDAETTQPSHWARVSSVLDSNLTGEATTFDSGVTVTPQLSFVNTEFNYCRQAEVASKDELNVMIACKDKQGAWQLAASKLDELGENAGQYQTATSAKVMEEELDKMMASAPLNREQEKNAIEATWLADKAEGVNDEN